MAYQIGYWDTKAQAYLVRDATPAETAEFDASKAKAAADAPLQLQAAGETAIQDLMDRTAQAHGYDSLERCIGYQNSGVAKWKNEGLNALAWRDACWTKGQQIMNDAKAGDWPMAGAGQMPTVDDVVAAMPPANWPTV